jgi:hypothetical protein
VTCNVEGSKKQQISLMKPVTAAVQQLPAPPSLQK